MQIRSVLRKQFHTTAMRTAVNQMTQSLPKYTYEELKSALKRPEALVIDVREQEELKETGEIPGAINIPSANIENAFTRTTDEKFEDLYGREKPGRDTEIVVSCRSGRRSAFVQNILSGMGFRKVYNYAGGWLDWEKHQTRQRYN